MNSFANIIFSFDQWQEKFMEHVHAVVSISTVTTFFMLLVIGIPFFYLAALINYETKDYKKTH